MATYATNTNPFIKTDSSVGRGSPKDAPGMAKPQTSLDCVDSSKPEVPNLLLNEKDSDNDGEVLDAKSSCNDEKMEPASVVDKPITKESNISQSDTDLVTDCEDEVDEENESTSSMEKDSRKQQHIELIKKLRLQLRDLEKYAFERGELEQIPPSVVAERQAVILDTLKDKLSLNICMEEIEKLELDELKKQVDKEINDLIDPLVTKDHLLGQLKTQLTDLERYISHLHGTLDKRSCRCHLHGCSSKSEQDSTSSANGSTLLDNESLPKTTRLIRSLVTQLICSDIKLQESAKKEKEFEDNLQKQSTIQDGKRKVCTREPQFHDGAAWILHLDKVILATDSLMNLFFLEPQYQRTTDKPVDERLVESVVRRQLVPAVKELLSYGLIDPNSSASSHRSSTATDRSSPIEKMHVWNVVEDYYKSKNEPGFKNSSVKTLSQSFNLEPSMDGPIKITSKQALLIAVDDIIETLAKCKPDGPESHFRAFIYTALNRSKLSTWLRLVFKNKSIVRKYYHNFGFVCQVDKMDKFLKTIEPLNQIQFKLSTDVESIEQYVSAF